MTESMREKIFGKEWSGCSNHDCIVTGPKKGMGTNGSCGCLHSASRTQLSILKSRLQSLLADSQPQQWIKCSDRLPTSADGDANRHVWFWSSITSSRPWLTSVDQLAITRSIDGHKGCFWMHTRLKRPEPPK